MAIAGGRRSRSLTWRGLHAAWPVYAIAAASSAAGAFDLPARQSLTPNLVPREHLPNALTLNTIMFQVAAVVGPALGGIVIGQLGVALGLRDQRDLVPAS